MKQMTLREARTLRDVTQEQLEAASGVDQAHISKLERGEIVDPANTIAAKLEAALRLKRGTLVFGQVRESRASA